MRCRPMALPRSCRSSSTPSIPTRCPACRAVPSRSQRSGPPAPYAHACRGTMPQPIANPSSSPSRSRPRRWRAGTGPTRPLPKAAQSTCRPAPPTPTPIRSAGGIPLPSAAIATPHTPARLSSSRTPRDAVRSGRSPDCANADLRCPPTRRRHRTSSTSSPPSTLSRPRTVRTRPPSPRADRSQTAPSLRVGPSSSCRPCSDDGEPIRYEPAGTTTISGHSEQSRNRSPAFGPVLRNATRCVGGELPCRIVTVRVS